MPRLTTPMRELWLWLLHDGRTLTIAQIAKETERDPQDVFDQISGMERRGLVDKHEPAPGTRRLRYAVTGTCQVPLGMHVAEVQLD